MNFEEILAAVSAPRLTYYSQYLNCNTNPSKVGAYYSFLELSGKFFPLIQLIEVSLRNSIHQIAATHYKNARWYEVHPTSEKSKLLVSNAIQKARSELNSVPTPDDIVSRLTLGFWVYMLDSEYRDTKSPCYLWTPENKKKVFSNARNAWGAELSIKAIFEEFQQVLNLRNRLFHHEPIWKKHGCNSLDIAVNNVMKNYDFLLKILAFISPAKIKLLTAMKTPENFKSECTIARVNAIIQELVGLEVPKESATEATV
jgi:hypothetical protein